MHKPQKNARPLSGIFIFYPALAIWLICISLLTGCASTPQSDQLRIKPPVDIPVQAELTDVPFFAQREYQCGPASLATVLNYRNIAVQPDDLTDRVYLPERKGSLQIEMIATARSYGVFGYQIPPELAAIIKEIDNGNPVLVFQNLSYSFWPVWHYAVVIGYDLETEELMLRSADIRRYVIDFDTFERTWQRADHWAYVFMKPGQIPATANPLDYTRVSNELLKAGQAQAALSAFNTGAEHWPKQSIILMALGNAEYAASHYEAAENAFRRELEQRSDNADAWNNLAYALVARHCHTTATDAINCALLLQPGEKKYLDSLSEITSMVPDNHGKCAPVQCPVNKKAK